MSLPVHLFSWNSGLLKVQKHDNKQNYDCSYIMVLNFNGRVKKKTFFVAAFEASVIWLFYSGVQIVAYGPLICCWSIICLALIRFFLLILVSYFMFK